MTGQVKRETGSRKHHWWSAGLLAMAVLALVLLSAETSSARGNVSGAVFDWAGQNWGDPVPVVVQTTGGSEDVAGTIESAGGSVEREFSIIPAIEARVPASSIAAVAATPGVAWVSLNAPVVSTGTLKVNTKAIAATYPFSVNANDPWSKNYTGAGVGIAIVDTGISPSGHEDFKGADGNSRVIAEVVVNPDTSNITDGYGHGTHIAGVAAGDGDLMNGKYVGIAPEANLINVKIADDFGSSTIADAIAGLEWVYNNRAAYNIRVVNLSLHSSTAESYRTSPLNAAVESLWFNGVFVVVAAGNLGTAADAVSYPPANDPFVMTAGAIDDRATSSYGDDVPTSWSSAGLTQDGFAKPELLTPGLGIISAIDTNSYLYRTYPAKIVDTNYFKLSGTSMAAGVMSGVAALVLERHPTWTPGELKCTLVTTARKLSPPFANLNVPRAGAASNQSSPSCNSDAGVAPSAGFARMLKAGVVAWVLAQPDQSAASTIGFDSGAAGIPSGATLATVDWSAIKWDAITWSAIKWDAIEWDAIKWDAIKWDSIKWDLVSPDGVNFSAITWSAIKWDAIKWDAIKWSAIKWDSIKWDAIKWDFVEGN